MGEGVVDGLGLKTQVLKMLYTLMSPFVGDMHIVAVMAVCRNVLVGTG